MKKYFKGIRGYIIGQVVLTTFYTASLAVLPLLFRFLFDAENLTIEFLMLLVALYITAILVNLFFSYTSEIVMWKGNILFRNLLKRDFFRAVSRM